MAHENKKEIATGYWRVMYCPENIKRVGRFIFFNISLFWKMAWREEFTKTMFQFPMRKRPFHRENGQKKRETCGIDRNHQNGKKNGKKKQIEDIVLLGMENGDVLGVGLQPRVEGSADGAEPFQRRSQLVRPADVQHTRVPQSNLLPGQRQVEHLHANGRGKRKCV